MTFRVPFSATPQPAPYKFGSGSMNSDSKSSLRRAGEVLATSGVSAGPPKSVPSRGHHNSAAVKASQSMASLSSLFSEDGARNSVSSAALLTSTPTVPAQTTAVGVAATPSSPSFATTLGSRPDLRRKIDKAYGFTGQERSRTATKGRDGVAGDRHVGFPTLSAEARVKARAMSVSFLTNGCVATSRPPSRMSFKEGPSKGPLLGATGSHTVRDVVKAQGYLFNQSINDLCRDTGFSRRDLYRMFSTFKALCALSNSPTGIGTEVVVAGENVRLACFSRDRPDKDTLGRCIPVLGVEDEEFVSRVFTVLDFDGSGEIEWDEFIEAMAAMEKGSREKRAEFLFRVYDENEDGLLNEAEFCKYFVAGMGVAKDDPYAMEVSKYFVRKLFEDMEGEGTTQINVKSVLRYLSRHPEITDVYGLFGRCFPEVDSVRPNEDPGAVSSPRPATPKSPDFAATTSPKHGSTLSPKASGQISRTKSPVGGRMLSSASGVPRSRRGSRDASGGFDFNILGSSLSLEAILAHVRPIASRESTPVLPRSTSPVRNVLVVGDDEESMRYKPPTPSEMAAKMWEEIEKRATERHDKLLAELPKRPVTPVAKAADAESDDDDNELPEIVELRKLVESMSRGDF